MFCVDLPEPDRDPDPFDEADENDGGNGSTTDAHLVSNLLERLPKWQEKKTPDKMGSSLSLLQLGLSWLCVLSKSYQQTPSSPDGQTPCSNDA